jgi:hypothetical protein
MISQQAPIQELLCSYLCREYIKGIHFHYPFISLASLAKMKNSFLDRQGTTACTSSDVIILLIIALGSIARRQEPLPELQISRHDADRAVRQNIDAIPGLKYYTFALNILQTMVVSDELHRVQLYLLIALYADQIMLLSVRHDYILRACCSCKALMER